MTQFRAELRLTICATSRSTPHKEKKRRTVTEAPFTFVLFLPVEGKPKLRMKVILFFVVSCLALHNGKGARLPRNAAYQFVRCNPEDDQSKCKTYVTPMMVWSPNLPAKLPSSTAQYLDAEPAPEEDDNQFSKSDHEEVETSMFYPTEEGSGMYEGSADSYMADLPAMKAESQRAAGRGESRVIGQLLRRRPLLKDATPAEQELKEDHLLQL